MAAMAIAERAQVMSALRIARRHVALIVGLADILGLWPLATVTAALSGFAEIALDGAIAHLLTGAARAGDIGLADPARPVDGSGLVVLGMGKLGGAELNYSSDIDLIILFDPEIVDYRGIGRTAARLCQAGARTGAPARGTHGRRLCLSHRPAPAPRSRRHARRDECQRRRKLL